MSETAFARFATRTKHTTVRVLQPIWSVIAFVLAPVDRALQPVANVAFNRTLGRHFGHVSGLQFALLFVGIVGIATFPIWAYDGLRLIQFPEFLPVVGGVILIDPELLPASYVNAAALACVWAIFAMSWDVQSGFTGYISFGHSVLSGAAAYAAAMILAHVNPEMNILLVATIAVVVSLVIGLLIALPSLRLQGPYFSLITFVAVLLMTRLVTAFSEWTGGELGLPRAIDRIAFDPGARFYWMAIPMFVIAGVLVYLARSNTGLILTAIRENEPAVSAAGISPTKFKIWSFVLSSIPMGIAGILLALYGGQVDPATFVVVDNSIEIIAIAVIGGMASILGPLFGAFLFVLLEREVLRQFFGHSTRWLMLWVFVLAVLVFARQGLFRLIWHGIGSIRGDSE